MGILILVGPHLYIMTVPILFVISSFNVCALANMTKGNNVHLRYIAVQHNTILHTYIHTYIAYAWLYQVAHLTGSRCVWLWFYWFLFIFCLIFIRALAMALLVSMFFSLNISAYLIGFSSLLIFVHSWMMCSWVSSASQQYLHLRVSWPFSWFILTVIMLVLALSIAWLCFLVNLHVYWSSFFGVGPLFSPVVDFCFFFCFFFYFLFPFFLGSLL